MVEDATEGRVECAGDVPGGVVSEERARDGLKRRALDSKLDMDVELRLSRKAHPPRTRPGDGPQTPIMTFRSH